LALPATTAFERRHPALAVTDALAAGLEKRQSSGNAAAVAGFRDLLQNAISSTSSKGKCSSECSSWVSSVTDCTRLGSLTEVGTCACGDTPVAAMTTCGDCFGSDSQQDVSNFAATCKNAIASVSSQLGGTASTSRASTATSGNSSPVSSAPSQSAPAQSAGSGAGTVKVGTGVLAGALGIALMA
ncbi:hypothetical protein JCM3766R1_004568, partial [Sporobolomyces carnicolor]